MEREKTKYSLANPSNSNRSISVDLANRSVTNVFNALNELNVGAVVVLKLTSGGPLAGVVLSVDMTGFILLASGEFSLVYFSAWCSYTRLLQFPFSCLKV